MKKIGICGVYGSGPQFSGGQPVKTRMVIDELKNIYGKDQVIIANTHNWRRKPIRLLIDCIKVIIKCENIIILPAHNGVKVFIPLFWALNKIYKKKLHYIVIGGWLPSYLKKYKFLLKCVRSFKGIYVETTTMKLLLESLNVRNVYIMNNFKRLEVVSEEWLNYKHEKPYKLCYFSRIVAEKGIEDAINSVISINETYGQEIFLLDIYGFIDDSYKDNFDKVMKESPSYIKYCGIVSPDESVDTLKKYFIQLFPTKFKTEGIPGSIIDSYYAGVPVLASKWNSFHDVIEEGKTGFGYELGNIKDLEARLGEIANYPQRVIDMKVNCIKKSKEYSSDYVIKKFIAYL